MKRTVFFTFFLLGAVLLDAADLTKNGEPAAVIVLAENPVRSAKFAAMELRNHIKLISGAELPIVSVPSESKTNLFVGEYPGRTPENGSFEKQEYLIRVKGSEIVLAGRDGAERGDFNPEKQSLSWWKEIGTCYAVYDFLERLGVRWYLPTELGTSFTPAKDLAIPDMEIRRKPFFRYRDDVCPGFAADLIGDTVESGRKNRLAPRDVELWHLRRRMGGEMMRINHSFYSYYRRFPEKKEWFAQGLSGTPSQMCYSNPEFIRQVVQDARDYFDGKLKPDYAGLPNLENSCFPLVPMDNGTWCGCPACRKKMAGGKKRGGAFWNDAASDYFFGFVNEVAREVKKTHPGKKIGVLAYHNYSYPPAGFKLEDNIVTEICLEERSAFTEAAGGSIEERLRAWADEYPQMEKFVWLYYCFPSMLGRDLQVRVFPGFFAEKIGEQFAKYVKYGISGVFIEPSYGVYDQIVILMDQAEYAILWSLALDEKTDPGKRFDEFFRLYYGPAEIPMKKFYRLVAERYGDPSLREAGGGIETFSWSVLGTEDVMNKLSGFMAEAEKLASAEPFAARVALFRKGVWEYMLQGRKTFLERASRMSGTMMQAYVPFLAEPAHGNPDAVNWNRSGRLRLYGGLRAEKMSVDAEVMAAHDGEYLYLMYRQNKIDSASLRTKSMLWENDEWETYFARQRGKPYRMFGIDANGAVQGETCLEIQKSAWEPGCVVRNVKTANGWTLRLALKLSEIVPEGIKPGEILYYNVIRASALKAVACWIPTFSGFHAPERLGELYLAPAKKP